MHYNHHPQNKKKTKQKQTFGKKKTTSISPVNFQKLAELITAFLDGRHDQVVSFHSEVTLTIVSADTLCTALTAVSCHMSPQRKSDKLNQ